MSLTFKPEDFYLDQMNTNSIRVQFVKIANELLQAHLATLPKVYKDNTHTPHFFGASLSLRRRNAQSTCRQLLNFNVSIVKHL